MASHEHDHHAPDEQNPTPYTRAARFADEARAGRAYFTAQDAIFHTPDSDLSVYRLHFAHAYHVAVLGLEPPRPLRRRLDRILASGEAATLPPTVMNFLIERRAEATRLGPWVERHRRPLPEEGGR